MNIQNCELPGDVTGAFDIPGSFVSAEPYGNGRINRTYLAAYSCDGETRRYIHQRINTGIFRDPEALMANMIAVTDFVAAATRSAGVADEELVRRVLTPVRVKDGGFLLRASDDGCWRTTHFVENALSLEKATVPAAYDAAKAYGAFLKLLDGFPVHDLTEIIPGFHDTPARLQAFLTAVESDSHRRLRDCRMETDALIARGERAGRLQAMHAAGEIPLRVTHNDTKLNNVLLDATTGGGVCVIDLDTVMAGFAAHDFGDMVRSVTNTAGEEAIDLGQVGVDIERFKALKRGYLESAGTIFGDAEQESLPEGVWAMTYELVLRFLTDHLVGDTYFGVSRPRQNLERARVQLTLLKDIERNWDTLTG